MKRFMSRGRGPKKIDSADEGGPALFLFQRSSPAQEQSPRSVGEKFDRRRLSPLASPPINADGDLYDSVAGEQVFADLTEEPSDRDYDFSLDAYMMESPGSPGFAQTRLHRKPVDRQRSKSVQRRLQGNDDERHVGVEATMADTGRNRRSKSTGRTERRSRPSDAAKVVVVEHESRPKKSKMEKIIQLQEKNQRYKDEFRKVQKDRKSLKKELEVKKLEVASLTKEIETHAAESAVLKTKLRDALLELDRSDHGERRDRASIAKLQRELAQVRGEYTAALARVTRMREEVESVRVSVDRKDDQIRSLTGEVTEQNALIDSLQMEIVQLRRKENHVVTQEELIMLKRSKEEEVGKLTMENKRMKDELSETVQRTSDMVKEREDAISELLKENEEMKTRLDRDESENSAAHEELLHLREELEASARALEASQDRNVLLEEELESWISRGQETETELLTVQDEAEEWHRQADSSMSALNAAEAKVKDATHRADTLEATVKALRKKHLEQLEEQEKRHTEALLDQKEKITAKLAEAENSEIPMNPQDMMLQKAVADRKAKDANKAGWGSVIQQFRNGSNETDEAQSDDRKRIQELERDNADKDEELAKTKSEVVRMRSSYNDTLYMNKKRIEELENENEECFAKLRAMEAELGALRIAKGDQNS